MLRILLVGKNGQLGWELHRALYTLGELTAVDFPEVDLERPKPLLGMIRELKPEAIVNAAAYTAVDKAEVERERAHRINAIAPGLLAEEARRLNAIFIHYSTDYVFDGKKGSPYTEADTPNPLNVYGLTKLEGEQQVQQVGASALILRTSWVYSLRQGGFVNKVLEWARSQETLRMVTDQVGNPTWCRALAEITAQMLARGSEFVRKRTGLYHLAGSGYSSRMEWAQLVLELDHKKEEQTVKQILPALTKDFPAPAERPLFSALDCNRFKDAFGLALPDWCVALGLALGN